MLERLDLRPEPPICFFLLTLPHSRSNALVFAAEEAGCYSILHNESDRLYSWHSFQETEHLIRLIWRVYLHGYIVYHGKFLGAKSLFPSAMILKWYIIRRALTPPVSLFDFDRIEVEEDCFGFLIDEAAGLEESEDGMALVM